MSARPGGGWALLARHLAPRRRALAHVVGWTAVESLPALASGLVIAASLDRGFLAGRPLAGLGWLGLLGLALAVRVVATLRLYPWLAEAVEPLRNGLIADVVTAAVTRGAAGSEAPGSADVARLSRQVETVRGLVSTLTRTVLQFGMTMLAALVGVAALAPPIALLVVPLVLVALGLYAILLRSLAARYRQVVLADEEIAQESGQMLVGLRDVLAYGAGQQVTDAVGAVIDHKAGAEQALARASALRMLIVALGAHLPLLTVLMGAPWLIGSQRLSIGAVTGAVAYLTTSLEPALNSLVNVAGNLGLGLSVTARRLAEACALPPSPPPRGRGLAPRGQDLQVERVTFAYGPTAEPIVSDLELRLGRGEHLAIVGPSGIGKSTLANLLAGVLQPQAGQIRLGGAPLGDIDDRWLRRLIALIPQEAYIFAGTLRENLTYLCPRATEHKIDAAVDAVGLRPTLDRLGGYHTAIGAGGVTLSEGERQLVALARVWLSPARLVILDEATCHLDPVAEADAENAFSTRPDTTLVIIAHRISSALRAKRILLMDGATPLLGTHDTLLAASPLYADLVGHWHHELPTPTGPR